MNFIAHFHSLTTFFFRLFFIAIRNFSSRDCRIMRQKFTSDFSSKWNLRDRIFYVRFYFPLLLLVPSTFPFMRTPTSPVAAKWVMTVNHRDGSVFIATLADREIWARELFVEWKSENANDGPDVQSQRISKNIQRK